MGRGSTSATSKAAADASWSARPSALIVNPRGAALGGNRVTGLRWAGILRRLGWRVRHAQGWDGRPAELLVALHAKHAALAVERFHNAQPRTPIIVTATGTDIHGEPSDRAVVFATLGRATRIVLLQAASLASLPEFLRERTRVIHQSVRAVAGRAEPRTDVFEVIVVANLRAVKDPLLTARAARALPLDSRVAVTLVGAVVEEELRAQLDDELARSSRLSWAGPLSHAEVLHRVARARVLVSSSLSVGGPAVVSEALALGVPLLATRIPGHVGLIGADHPGLFEPGDASALSRLLLRCEREPRFLAELVEAGAHGAANTRPHVEEEAWRALLAELFDQRA